MTARVLTRLRRRCLALPEAHEVEALGIRALEHHVERRMRSTALL
jgi:hypothetical protein